MSPAALSFPLVVLALFVGAAWVAAALALPLWLRAAAARDGLTRSAGLVAAAPWLVGLAVALAAVLPGDPHTGRALACHCAESMPGWLHLCPLHPEQAAWLALPAAALLVALLPGRVRAVVALAREPVGGGGGDAPRVVDLGARVALLHGWLRPTLVVDRRLWEALSAVERDAVLAHERAHLARRDPLVLMGLRALLVLAPPRLAARVARVWLDRAERRADAEAARRLGDPGLVARALVRCARLGPPAPTLATGWTGGRLEDRVLALVHAPGAAAPARPDLGPLDLLALLALALLAAAATPWIHHQLEHLLNGSL
jgi:Zn-dependent protease with chaperone function